jgi:hypothetical protein
MIAAQFQRKLDRRRALCHPHRARWSKCNQFTMAHHKYAFTTSDPVCDEHRIEHRLTKNQTSSWTNGYRADGNWTIKEVPSATIMTAMLQLVPPCGISIGCLPTMVFESFCKVSYTLRIHLQMLAN